MPFFPDPNPANTVPRGSFEGTLTRSYLHNMAANPGVARRYMASLGDQIRDYGNGNDWNWAWRKTDADPWIPAESHGFVDFMLDHIADAVIGAGTGIAATLGAGLAAESGPGAILAGAAAGGAASGALEAGRQALGAATGIPDNVDVPQVAGATLGGALAEPLGAAGGAILRGTGRALGATVSKAGTLTAEIAAKIGGITPLGTSGLAGTTAGDVLTEGARLTNGGRVPLIDPDRAGITLLRAIGWIRRVGIPEAEQADAKVIATKANGVTFNLKRAIDTIQDKTVSAVSKSTSERAESIYASRLSADSADLLNRITTATGYTGDWAAVPGDVATVVRKGLQKEAAEMGAYRGTGQSPAYVNMVKQAAAQARVSIESGMAPIDPQFSGLMDEAYKRMQILDWFKAKLKMGDRGFGSEQAASNYIRGVYGENKIAYLRALNDLDAHFSTGLRGRLVDRAVASVKAANIGAAIGNRGTGELLPRLIGPGGHIRSGVAALGLGYYAGGLPGLALSGIAASPKVILRSVAPAQAAGRAVAGAASALARVHLGGAARVVATGTLDAAGVSAMRKVIRSEGGGSKGIVRQEEGKPKRRQIVIGR